MADSMNTSVWADLVVALLSVNNYPAERTYKLLDALGNAGLAEPDKLASFSEEEIARKLCAAGYKRGVFLTGVFAERLAALGRFVRAHGREQCEPILEGQDYERVRTLLSSVKGIGPTVVKTFIALRRS